LDAPSASTAGPLTRKHRTVNTRFTMCTSSRAPMPTGSAQSSTTH